MHLGWDELDSMIDSTKLGKVPEYSHSQIQTFLGSIGVAKGYDVWIPQNDRAKLEWSLTGRFDFRDQLPYGFEKVADILQEVDIIWIERGSANLRALFEVEHSTPIYSGLLRFDDIHLVAPNLRPRFSVVANDVRRVLFVRQMNRPTFKTSGLSELCTFFEYANVVGWHNRIRSKPGVATSNVQ
jgi:type II restriction enzyme